MANRLKGVRRDHRDLYMLRDVLDPEDLAELLNECPDQECTECGWIMCPHGDEMHFHHDGCPSCSAAEQHG